MPRQFIAAAIVVIVVVDPGCVVCHVLVDVCAIHNTIAPAMCHYTLCDITVDVVIDV